MSGETGGCPRVVVETARGPCPLAFSSMSCLSSTVASEAHEKREGRERETEREGETERKRRTPTDQQKGGKARRQKNENNDSGKHG